MFKDHPSYSTIKFVVHPLLRENMHTVCDLPEEFDITRKEIPLLELDLAFMAGRDHKKWYLQDLQDPVRTKLLDRCSRDS